MRSGIFAQMRGELDDATARLEAAAELAAESGDRVAALVLGAAEAQLKEVGAVLESTERPLRNETLERLKSALGSEALETRLPEGAALPFGEAVDTARRLAAEVIAH